MTDVFDEMLEDVADPIIPDDDALKGVSNLVQHQINLETTVEKTEEHLKELRKKLHDVQTRALPEAMQALELSVWEDIHGNRVEVKPFVSASITEKNKDAAHDWLRANRHGDLIKTALAADIGRDSQLAETVSAALTKIGVPFVVREGVHAGTLKAWIKEQVGAGMSIPLELFGAYIGQKSTIRKGSR